MKVRKLRCRQCDEKWSGRRGRLHDWYQKHLKMHGLEEPKRQEGEDVDTWVDRLTDWRNEHFEDSLYPYWLLLREQRKEKKNEEPRGVSG